MGALSVSQLKPSSNGPDLFCIEMGRGRAGRGAARSPLLLHSSELKLNRLAFQAPLFSISGPETESALILMNENRSGKAGHDNDGGCKAAGSNRGWLVAFVLYSGH